MKVKVFETDKNGKIVFTKDELERLLNEVYDSGYLDGKNSTYVWSSPYKWTLSGNEVNYNTVTAQPQKIKYEPTCKPNTITCGGEVHNTIGD